MWNLQSLLWTLQHTINSDIYINSTYHIKEFCTTKKRLHQLCSLLNIVFLVITFSG